MTAFLAWLVYQQLSAKVVRLVPFRDDLHSKVYFMFMGVGMLYNKAMLFFT